MPSLSKKKRKGPRGGEAGTVWSLREAESILKQHADEKFRAKQTKLSSDGDWKYGHMKASQALSLSDKHFMKIQNKARGTHGVDQGRDLDLDFMDVSSAASRRRQRADEGSMFDGADLEEFAAKQSNIHKMRSLHSAYNDGDSDFDPSASDLDDSDLVEAIHEDDDIFADGKKKKKKKRRGYDSDDALLASDGENDESDFLVSSGDDLDADDFEGDTVADSQKLSRIDGDLSDESSMADENEGVLEAADESQSESADGLDPLHVASKRRRLADSANSDVRISRRLQKDKRTIEDGEAQSEIADQVSGLGSEARKMWGLSGKIEGQGSGRISLWNQSSSKEPTVDGGDDEDDDVSDASDAEVEDEHCSDDSSSAEDLGLEVDVVDDGFGENNDDLLANDNLNSSEEDEDIVDRRRSREQQLHDEVQSGVGRLKWGRHKSNYYGTDTERSKLIEVDGDEADEALRTEEAIGIQQQRDAQMSTRKTDYFDEEIMSVMRKTLAESEKLRRAHIAKEVKTERKQALKQLVEAEKSFFQSEEEALKSLSKIQATGNRTYVPPVSAVAADVTQQHSDEDVLDEAMDVDVVEDSATESVRKDLSTYGDEGLLRIIKRDHPELPGVVSELRTTLAEMRTAKEQFDETQRVRYDAAMNDATLFLDLLRNYAAILSFYLQLKTKNRGNVPQTHPIFGRMLEMKNAVASMRPIHCSSFEFMKTLPPKFNNKLLKKQAKKKLEKVLAKKARAKSVAENNRRCHEGRILKEKKRRQMAKKQVAGDKRREAQAARDEKAKKYTRIEDRRLTKWQRSSDGGMDPKKMAQEMLGDEDVEAERRHINQRIFKAVGLKRYRKKGIPRLKQKMKYTKKMKIWKMKGYAPYKGKIPGGRGERRITTHISHSVKF